MGTRGRGVEPREEFSQTILQILSKISDLARVFELHGDEHRPPFVVVSSRADQSQRTRRELRARYLTPTSRARPRVPSPRGSLDRALLCALAFARRNEHQLRLSSAPEGDG